MAQREAELLTQAAYARHRQAAGLPGGSREAVRKAVDEGRITLISGRIHARLADEDWERNTRARVSPQAQGQAGAGQGAAPGGDTPPTPIEAAAAAAPASPPAPAPAPDTGYNAARARREIAEAEQAEIELQRKKGELVLREDVDRAFGEIMREVRDRLQATARRTAAEVSSLASAEACETVIDREHRIVLELLVASFREKVGAPPSRSAA